MVLGVVPGEEDVAVRPDVRDRQRGYRDIFQHFVKLRLAAQVPFTKKLLHTLLEGKDIAELYELWCYFAVVRELERLLGRPIRAQRPTIDPIKVRIPCDFEVTWSNGVRAFYNRSFSRSRDQSRFSYSVLLRPDICISVPRGENQELHLLDAKFKLDQLDQLLTESTDDADPGGDEEAANERRGTFKRGDLYKMHSYRDAIRDARSVWILYPGHEARFFAIDGTCQEDVKEGFRQPIEGVGAIPLIPDSPEHTQLLNVLRHLLPQPLADTSEIRREDRS